MMKHIFFKAFLLSLPFLIWGDPIFAKGATLRVHNESQPKTLDPSKATGSREFQILQALFEGLTRYQPKTLTPLPGVAEKWEVSADGLRYLFHLRTNAKWSDGKPVTAQDFFDSWEHLLNPKTQSPYAFQLFYLKGAQAYNKGECVDAKQIGMRVVDPHTFEVTLERPVPYFLSLTSFSALAPLRKEITEPHLIGNGPFVFQSNDPNEGILLLPNPHYWGKKEIKLSGVQFRPFGDFAIALTFYDRTGIDIMTDLPPQKVPMLKFRHDFKSAPMLRTDYFIFNCLKPPFDNVKVRQAMAYALQRPKITDKILKRGDKPYGYFVPPGMPGYTSPPNPQGFDLVKAKQLLKAAGISPEKPFPVFQIHYNNVPDKQLVVEAAQQMWRENLGLESSLKGEEWTDFLKTRQKRELQVSYGGWTGDYVDPNTFLGLFISDNSQNHSGWSNPQYDALIKKAQETPDAPARNKLYREAEKILLEEAVVIPVFVKTKNYLIQPYIRGYFPNLLDTHPVRDVYSLRP
ncbi:MAG: peptide ABC transporter substrate-binding protein [Deltaproteobacteria bacterium]|nr:peptide ABC transporter substrate-binding protein [Deltaproteobacteria bacterium]